MLITNSQHLQAITDEIKSAQNVCVAMAYVSDAGTNKIIIELGKKNAKLVCNLDLGITTLNAIKTLLDNNVQVKIYTPTSGIFHPKVWIFKKKDNPHTAIIGSANLTLGGIQNNVEASILIDEKADITDAQNFFNDIWNDKNVEVATLDKIESLNVFIKEKQRFIKKTIRMPMPRKKENKIAELLKFTKSWIDIPTKTTIGGSRAWRGWYILPDQGEINDNLIGELKKYLPYIKGNLDISKSSKDPNWKKIHGIFSKLTASRTGKKTSPRDLFIRSHKNFLINFNWVEHTSKSKQAIRLTPLGIKIRDAKNIDDVKSLYTDYFMEFKYYDFKIFEFLKNLLQRIDYLTFDEMNYFVKHATSADEIDIMVRLIKTFRSLTTQEQKDFYKEFKEYFDIHKEPTGNSVYGNYTKSIRTLMNTIAWCDGFKWDGKKLELD